MWILVWDFNIYFSKYTSVEYVKYLTFKTDFCTKSENSPPSIGFGNKNVTTLTLNWKRIRSQNFWSSPNFEHKTGPNPNEDLFLWSSRKFGLKIVPIPNVNCFSLVSHLRNSPPHCKFQATRLPSSLPVMVAQPDERLANRTQKTSYALMWLDRRKVPGSYERANLKISRLRRSYTWIMNSAVLNCLTRLCFTVPGQCCPVCPDTSCLGTNGSNHTAGTVWKEGLFSCACNFVS